MSQKQEPSVWLEFSPLAVKSGAINLGQGFPSWQPPAFIQEAAAKAVRGAEFSSYARSQGHPRLVEQIKEEYSQRLQRDLDGSREILVTVGASQALFLSIMTFAEPSSEVILLEPAFDIYYGALAMKGAKIKSVSMMKKSEAGSTQIEIDFDGLKKALSDKTKLLILNTPNNPTGKVWTQKEIQKLADILCDYPACKIISDEVYEHLVYDGKEHVAIASHPQLWQKTISIYSAGKSFSVTGWKVGWAIGPVDLIGPLQHTQQWVVFSVATPLQEAVASALKEGRKEYQEGKSYYKWLKDLYERKRDLLYEGLERAGFCPLLPEGGFFILCDIENQDSVKMSYPEKLDLFLKQGEIKQDSTTTLLSDYNFCRNLTLDKGVAPIPVSAFCEKNGRHQFEHLARFAFCKSDEVLKEAIKRLNA